MFKVLSFCCYKVIWTWVKINIPEGVYNVNNKAPVSLAAVIKLICELIMNT